MRQPLPPLLVAIFFIATCSLSTRTAAQNDPKPGVSSVCPAAAELGPLQLYGLWRAEFDGGLAGATLRLEKHPELAGSVVGRVRREGPGAAAPALVAGDVDQGEFNLDESADGHGIAATWTGQVVNGSCGKEIRGTWHNATDHTTRGFVLRKQPGWQ